MIPEMGIAAELRRAEQEYLRLLKAASWKTKFWSKIEIVGDDDCWVWRGYILPVSGYGRFNSVEAFPGRGYMTTHRIAYLLVNGDIPPDKVVCHSCDNRWCCNPAHLWLGTQQDNWADMRAKGRHIPPPRTPKEKQARGETQGQAKLSDAIVREIRKSDETAVALAERYGVSPRTVGYVRNGQTWAHVV